MTLAVPNPRRKSAFTLSIEAAFDAMPLTVGCIIDGCRWNGYTGPAGEARERARAHRADKHPDRPLIAKRPKRPKPVPQPKTRAPAVAVSYPSGKPKRQKLANGRPPIVMHIDATRLRMLYVDERRSQMEVAKILGVSQWSVSQALKLRDIPRHRTGVRRGFVTAEREQAAWRLYEAGLSVWQIAGLCFDVWGYSNPLQAKRSLLKAFGNTGRKTRPACRHSMVVPELNRSEALAILKDAEA